MQTNNPAFQSATFGNFDWADSRANTMTVQGTAIKSFLLLAILMLTASFSWTQAGNHQLNPILLGGSFIGGLVVFVVTLFKKEWSPITAPLYAALEGVLLGAISNMVNQKYHGIAVEAVALTCGTLFVMLVIYATGLVKVTDRLKTGIIAATGALALFYLIAMVMSMFGGRMPLIYDSSPIGIGFSLLVVGLAAFNLLLDFDFIDKGARASAPKYMEWYAAFGLMVTLIWLYLEILRLLRKVQSRR